MLSLVLSSMPVSENPMRVYNPGCGPNRPVRHAENTKARWSRERGRERERCVKKKTEPHQHVGVRVTFSCLRARPTRCSTPRSPSIYSPRSVLESKLHFGCCFSPPHADVSNHTFSFQLAEMTTLGRQTMHETTLPALQGSRLSRRERRKTTNAG